MAFAVIGLVPLPKAARPVKARTRKAHAGNARKAIAEARQLTPEARRHLAEISPALPEGWQLGGEGRKALATAGQSFAEGFRTAVADHVGRLNGTAPAPAPAEGWPICDGCGCDFDPEISRDPSFCEMCVAEGGAA
jgi:hypothetical protein